MAAYYTAVTLSAFSAWVRESVGGFLIPAYFSMQRTHCWLHTDLMISLFKGKQLGCRLVYNL